jgi:hypothetical protein
LSAPNVFSRLTEIELNYNSLGTNDWCAIFKALRDNNVNKIAKWDLSGQQLTWLAYMFTCLYLYMFNSTSRVVFSQLLIAPHRRGLLHKIPCR